MHQWGTKAGIIENIGISQSVQVYLKSAKTLHIHVYRREHYIAPVDTKVSKCKNQCHPNINNKYIITCKGEPKKQNLTNFVFGK